MTGPETTISISRDDPDVIHKLMEKVKSLEAERERAKRINSYYRKNKTLIGCPEINQAETDKIRSDMERSAQFGGRSIPFPSYFLRNIGSRIKSTHDRIQELRQSLTASAPEPLQGQGYSISEHFEDKGGRIWVVFDEKPSRLVLDLLTSLGWRYSHNRTAWICYLNNAGRNRAERTFNALEELNDNRPTNLSP